MGLRTASTTSPTSGSNNSNIYLSQNDQEIISDQRTDEQAEETKTLQLSNVSVHSNMAPALTEPLSQTNKLSSSTTSASPRPTSNNLLINNNHTVENNNINTASHLESSKDSLNGTKLVKDVAPPKGTFQLAFERVVAKQAAAAAAARQKQLEEITIATSSNGPVSNDQMGPMCDTNSSNTIDLNLDSDLAGNQTNQECEDEEEQKSVEELIVLKQEQEGQIEHSEEEHMDVLSCVDKNEEQNRSENSLRLQEVTEEIEITTSAAEITTTTTISETSVDTSHCDIEEIPKVEENPTPPSPEDQQPSTSSESHSTEQPSESQKDQSVDLPEIPTTSIEDENIVTSSPPRTPPPVLSSPQQQNSQSQSQTTPISSLTPQSTTSGMGLQKDFIKDSAEMDQVLGDMDLLQVLKGFDTNPSGESLCDLAGSLVFFNDVDVMNYEDMGTPAKDSETKEVRLEIEKRQQQMQRKCDFLLRRLKKIQSRYMGKHASEEIAGMFEWTNRVVRRKDHEHSRLISYEEDKHRPVSTASMRVLLKRIDTVATAQHSDQTKKNKTGRMSSGSSSTATTEHSKPPITSVVPQFDEKTTEEFGHISGMLQTELKQVQSCLDSDVTASSSGGESADEMVTYNNQMQQSLSIAKRATWRWARDRAGIASRWTWLLSQISDLEYRIRQHNELHHQIKKNKGAVTFEKIPSNQQTSTCSNSNTTNITGTSSCSDNISVQTLPPTSVNGYRGILPGNSKPMDVDSVPPNGAYESSPTSSTGSCRTKPFQRAGFRKRKLLQTANVHTVSKKAARSSTVKCGCQWPLHPCALCTGRSDPTAPRDLPDTMTPSNRVALLDSGFHPVLSFPEDVSNCIHLEATMRSPEWQNRVLRCSSKSILKGAVAAQKAAEREDRSKKYLDSRRKYNRKYTTQDIMAANKLKNAKNRRALHTGQINNHLIKSKHQRKLLSTNAGGNAISSGSTTTTTSGNVAGGSSGIISGGCGGGSGIGDGNNTNGNGSSGNCNTFAQNSYGNGGFSTNNMSDATFASCNTSDNFDGINGLLPRSKNSSPTPGSHSSSSFKSERMDRRNRNSYDIDNIVIPYSVAASTRVEILPYKEIPTPKWRLLEDDLSDLKETNTTEINENSNSTSHKEVSFTKEEEDGDEDISEEAIQIRHERALLEERKKFQTYLKFPWSTRSRANRRIDSRAESSGANTPDPTSPAPNTPSVGGGDQESIPSPAAPSTPQTPLEALEGGDINLVNNQNPILTPGSYPLNNISNSAAKRVERRRTVSLKKERDSANREENRRSSSPDPKETIPPFEPLQFPLSDELYEVMLQMMPNDHQIMEDCLKTYVCDGNSIGLIEKQNFSGKGSGIGRLNNYDGNSSGIMDIMTSNNSLSLHDNNALACELAAFETEDSLLMGPESETDSADSALQDEDPNDPEWREPA